MTGSYIRENSGKLEHHYDEGRDLASNLASQSKYLQPERKSYLSHNSDVADRSMFGRESHQGIVSQHRNQGIGKAGYDDLSGNMFVKDMDGLSMGVSDED